MQNDYVFAVDEGLLVFVERSIRTLYVTTAYINKNDTIAEAGDALSLNPDVQNGLQSDVSSNIIITKDK